MVSCDIIAYNRAEITIFPIADRKFIRFYYFYVKYLLQTSHTAKLCAPLKNKPENTIV